MPQQQQQKQDELLVLFVSGQCVHDRCAVPAGMSYRIGYVFCEAFEWAPPHYETLEWALHHEAFEWAPHYDAFEWALDIYPKNLECR